MNFELSQDEEEAIASELLLVLLVYAVASLSHLPNEDFLSTSIGMVGSYQKYCQYGTDVDQNVLD